MIALAYFDGKTLNEFLHNKPGILLWLLGSRPQSRGHNTEAIIYAVHACALDAKNNLGRVEADVLQ